MLRLFPLQGRKSRQCLSASEEQDGEARKRVLGKFAQSLLLRQRLSCSSSHDNQQTGPKGVFQSWQMFWRQQKGAALVQRAVKLGVPCTVRVTLPGCRIDGLLSLTSTRPGTGICTGDSGSVDVADGSDVSDVVVRHWNRSFLPSVSPCGFVRDLGKELFQWQKNSTLLECCCSICAGWRCYIAQRACAGNVSSKTTCTLECAGYIWGGQALGERVVSGRCLLVLARFSVLC